VFALCSAKHWWGNHSNNKLVTSHQLVFNILTLLFCFYAKFFTFQFKETAFKERVQVNPLHNGGKQGFDQQNFRKSN